MPISQSENNVDEKKKLQINCKRKISNRTKNSRQILNKFTIHFIKFNLIETYLEPKLYNFYI